MEDPGAQLVREARIIERLRGLVERYVGERDRGLAEEGLAALVRHLRSRIQFEEESLFPAVERLVHTPRFEPTARMRRQHAVLLELAAGVTRALDGGAWATAAGDLRELSAALRQHVEEETRVLGPILRQYPRGRA